MSDRDFKEEVFHTQLVKAQIKSYENKGCSSIKADDINHPNGAPDKIRDHVPDVTAFCDEVFVVAEAETETSIDLEETRSQWEEFSEYASGDNKRFDVVVPASILEKAKDNARKWRIRVDKWWHLDV